MTDIGKFDVIKVSDLKPGDLICTTDINHTTRRPKTFFVIASTSKHGNIPGFHIPMNIFCLELGECISLRIWDLYHSYEFRLVTKHNT